MSNFRVLVLARNSASLPGVIMGNSNSNPRARLTLGPCRVGIKKCIEFDMQEYWDISDNNRFFHLVWKTQPELKKSVEVIWDCELFIQQGPFTGDVFSISLMFNNSRRLLS